MLVEYTCVVTITEGELRDAGTNGGLKVDHPKGVNTAATVIKLVKVGDSK